MTIAEFVALVNRGLPPELRPLTPDDVHTMLSLGLLKGPLYRDHRQVAIGFLAYEAQIAKQSAIAPKSAVPLDPIPTIYQVISYQEPDPQKHAELHMALGNIMPGGHSWLPLGTLFINWSEQEYRQWRNERTRFLSSWPGVSPEALPAIRAYDEDTSHVLEVPGLPPKLVVGNHYILPDGRRMPPPMNGGDLSYHHLWQLFLALSQRVESCHYFALRFDVLLDSPIDQWPRVEHLWLRFATDALQDTKTPVAGEIPWLHCYYDLALSRSKVLGAEFRSEDSLGWTRVVRFNGWWNYIVFTLIADAGVASRNKALAAVRFCQHCGGLLWQSGRRDRRHCRKAENPECVKEWGRLRQRRHEAKTKKKN